MEATSKHRHAWLQGEVKEGKVCRICGDRRKLSNPRGAEKIMKMLSKTEIVAKFPKALEVKGEHVVIKPLETSPIVCVSRSASGNKRSFARHLWTAGVCRRCGHASQRYRVTVSFDHSTLHFDYSGKGELYAGLMRLADSALEGQATDGIVRTFTIEERVKPVAARPWFDFGIVRVQPGLTVSLIWLRGEAQPMVHNGGVAI